MANRRLRSGFSTGTAATAAAQAALTTLLSGGRPESVVVDLPIGGELRVAVASIESGPDGGFRATVIKDAGDDPDVTNGAAISAETAWRETATAPGPLISGGPGVGRVTKPGLPVPVGRPAINPVPRSMITAGIDRVWNELRPKAEPAPIMVTISVADGERLARRTLNPRLGITGGLSILGTTGLVKPYSHEAYVATIESALAVARAAGLTEVVLTTGGRSEKAAMKLRPDLPEAAFVQMADYFQVALSQAGKSGFSRVGLVSFFGKAVKQAQGLACTHAHQAGMDLAGLAGWLAGAGTDPFLTQAVAQANTAREVLELLTAHDRLDMVKTVAGHLIEAARRYLGSGPTLWAAVVDYHGGALSLIE